MIRILIPLTLLAACAQFPQVDAAAPSDIAQRPPYLTPSELAVANARAKDIPDYAALPEESDLRARADDLRKR